MERRSLGSWLQGPGAAGRPAAGTDSYPGQRLGLPEEGPGSIAGFGIRLLAFVLDAIMCRLVHLLLLPDLWWGVTLVFGIEAFVLTAFGGASAGQRLLRLRIVRLDGRPVWLGTSFIRTALLLLLIPVLATDRDGRGLHDKAAGTVVLRG
jgi:uncharacterized RDD family membrane protein YckC